MKQLLLMVMAAGIVLASCNSSAKPAANAKNVEAVINDSSKYTTLLWQDTAIDFGTKKMGDMVNVVFTCKNTGDKPLYLYQVHPSCGCTLVDYSKEPIAPGKEGVIKAKFDTNNHPGSIRKTVYVRTNTDEKSRYLIFTGTVEENSASSAKN